MSNNAEMNVSQNDSMVDALLQVSNLKYKMPASLGIVSRRNHRQDFFQQSSYNAGETMVLDCQTGSDFVDTTNSWLVFSLSAVTNPGDLASGSVANVLNRILIKTRTGKEWSRVENANLLIKFLQVYDCEQDWKNTIGKSQGYGNDKAGPNEVPTDGKVYVLPLWVIPCFNRKELCPSQTMEGLRIELYTEQSSVALSVPAGSPAPTGYKINNPRIQWDCYDLGDAYKRKISEMASKQGLNLLHKEYFHTIVAAGSAGQKNFNFDVKKAATKALKCHVITRANESISNQNYDALGSLRFDYQRIQAHIGADYFPQVPITCESPFGANRNAEVYYFSMFGHGKTNQCWNPPSVTPAEFTSINDTVTAQPEYENCMITFNLNKSNVSDLQGYIVNTSRALLVDMDVGELNDPFPIGNNNVVRRLDVYLCHLRLLKQYISNAEIRD
jgi:hypothetical protein